MSVSIKDTFNSKFPDIGSLITSLLPNLLVLAGAIFFLVMVGAGFI